MLRWPWGQILAIHFKIAICKWSSPSAQWGLFMGRHHRGHRPGRPQMALQSSCRCASPYDGPSRGTLLGTVFPGVCLGHHSCTVGISDSKIILGSSGLEEFQLTSSCKPVILSLTIDRYIATDKGLVQNPRTHHWGALKDSCHLPQSKVYELSPFVRERATWWSEENLLVIRWQCLTLSLLKVIISLFRRYCSLFQINGIWWCIRD